MPIVAPLQIIASAKAYITRMLTEAGMHYLVRYRRMSGAMIGVRLLQACSAPAKDHNVMCVGDKAELAVQLFDQWRQILMRKLKGSSTRTADCMMMRTVRAQGVLSDTCSHVGFSDQVQLFEQIECAVDSGQVDVPVHLLYRSKDALGREMAR